MASKSVEPITCLVAPSDLTFLLRDCLPCFYRKVRLGERRPSGAMPAIFSRMDRRQRAFFDGRRTEDVLPQLRPGVLGCQDLAVRSAPIRSERSEVELVLRGAIDASVRYDTKDFGIIDFKTTSAHEGLDEQYSMQLHAYTYALEHPAPGLLPMSPIRTLGLLCIDPQELVAAGKGAIHYLTDVTYIDVPPKKDEFLGAMRLVLEMLEGPAPAPNGKCPYCRYRAIAA